MAMQEWARVIECARLARAARAEAVNLRRFLMHESARKLDERARFFEAFVRERARLILAP